MRNPCFVWCSLVATLALVAGTPLSPAQTLLTEDSQLVAADGAAGDQLGHRVDVQGDVAVVGAPFDDHAGGTDAGAVYVYRRTGTTWAEEAKLTEVAAATGNRFGWSVAVSVDTIVVGAIANPAVSGSVYVYRFLAGTWQLEATLGHLVTGGFGYAVDIDGDLIIAGQYIDPGMAPVHGTATIYRRTPNGWLRFQTIFPPDGAQSDWFGLAVAISRQSARGAVALVASQLHDAAGADAGAVYTYRFSPLGIWLFEQKLLAPDAAPGDSFGIGGVAVGDDLAAVGAWPKDEGGLDRGAAYAYRFNGATWSAEKLSPPDPHNFGYFGFSVAVGGRDTVVVGSLSNVDGAAYLFRNCGPSFALQRKLVQSSPASDQVGRSVSIDGAIVLCGASMDDVLGVDSGSAFLFTLPALVLNATPKTVTAGSHLTFTACGGIPGNPCMLFLSSLDGAPFFRPVIAGSMNALGQWSLVAVVSSDPNLPGHAVGFTLFALGTTGIDSSNAEVVSFQ